MVEQNLNENKKIFEYVIEVFGKENKSSIRKDSEQGGTSGYGFDILSCQDSPFERVTSYSTIALSDFYIGKDGNGIPLGVELVGACDTMFGDFFEIIKTSAYMILENHQFCPPGTILKDAVKCSPNSPMKHVLLANPFGWKCELESLYFQNKTVAWLFIVPISDTEMKYAKMNGIDALENLFEQKQIDTYDLNRKSVV
jgi:antitoxin YqcF